MGDRASEGGAGQYPSVFNKVISNIFRIFSAEDSRFTIEGVVSGNADGVDCSGTLPDFYTFVAHEKVLNTS